MYQALPALSYCNRQKLGVGQGTRLGTSSIPSVEIVIIVLFITSQDDESLNSKLCTFTVTQKEFREPAPVPLSHMQTGGWRGNVLRLCQGLPQGEWGLDACFYLSALKRRGSVLPRSHTLGTRPEPNLPALIRRSHSYFEMYTALVSKN